MIMATLAKQTEAADWLSKCVADMIVKLDLSYNEASVVLLKETVRLLNQDKCGGKHVH